ncbi:MAG: Bug family tripartite tricarboxylate transporter substrate binding protein [Burkholderiales bacterium]
MALIIPFNASGQTYPNKPIRVILPQPAGQGPSDVSTRLIAQAVSTSIGQPLIVENRPGAAGAIGLEACARAAPDGYTVCVTSANVMLLTPHLVAKLAYDAQKAFVPVITMGAFSSALVANPGLAANSVREMFDLARAKPGALTLGTFGITNLYLPWLKREKNVVLYDIPYKTAAQTLAGAISGDLHLAIFSVGGVAPMAKSGKVRALAVSGDRRSPYLPEVPTFREAGIELDIPNWFGVFAPTGIPNEAVTRLNSEINKVLADAKIRDQLLERAGMDATGGTTAQFAALVAKDRELFASLVKAAGIKPE